MRKLIALLLLSMLAAGGAAAAPTVKLRFGHTVPETDSQHIAALRFAQRVKERTQGAIEIQVYASSQLGNDGTLVTGVRSGTIDIGATGNPFLTGIVPTLNVLDLPYQFDDAAQAYRVLDGPVGRGLLDELSKHQMIGLAFWEIGFRSLANNRQPVNRAEDIKGLKIRTTPNPSHLYAFELLGANPQPMPFGEVFNALESGAVDGHENPPTLMYSSKMYEVQKYLSLTRHAYTALPVFINKRRFERLTAEQQKILREEALEAGRYQRDLNAKNEAAALAKLKSHGMQVNENPDLASIRKIVVEPVRKQFIDKYGDTLQKAIDAQR